MEEKFVDQGQTPEQPQTEQPTPQPQPEPEQDRGDAEQKDFKGATKRNRK